LGKKLNKFDLKFVADKIPAERGFYRKSINGIDCGEEGMIVFKLDLESGSGANTMSEWVSYDLCVVEA